MSYYCPGHFTSTYQAAFKVPPPGEYTVHTSPIQQTDETLIAGHFANNLQVNGKMPTTKVWPKNTATVEEYKNFVKRLERCKSELYKLYFDEECLGFNRVELMLQDLEKTTYQNSFSPNVYLSIRDKNRCSRFGSEPTGMKYQPTTYATYYSRLAEIGHYANLVYPNIDKKPPSNESRIRKMMKTGRTTYWSDICFPAIVKYREQPRKEVPLDRYSRRRI